MLNPEAPLFREARSLLAEETEIRDPSLYHSVLAAVADGNTTSGGIAAYVGRKSNEIAHPLRVLEDSHLLVKERDLFRPNRSYYRVTEPLVTFYSAIMARGVGTARTRRRGRPRSRQPHADPDRCRRFGARRPWTSATGALLGEVKWDKIMGAEHVARLGRARDLLAAKGFDTRNTVLTCYSGADFALGSERDVRLVTLDQLYT